MTPKPIITDLEWRPPSMTDPIVQAKLPNDRLMLYADADSHSGDDWQGYVPDIPGAANPTGGSTLVAYWDGGPAEYTLTLRSYWVLVPGSYMQLEPGESFQKTYRSTHGITESDLQTISAELGLDIEGFQAKMSASFSHEITTSSEQQEETMHHVDPPAEGFTRVWMLWQLVDEIVALDKDGNIISNPTRRGDVNWSAHAPSGAYLSYHNLHQHFPSDFIVSASKDFPH
ncbi:hypothetical protein NDA01_24705 [Trichocoleus desertorum AS-A10]|uniref:hypothetical protein n=1 Tax=Trichocoleus desertorum TaxID=1481672 RepID=UPI003299978E